METTTKTIKIAPSRDEITIRKNIMNTTFNKMELTYTMEKIYKPYKDVKDAFSLAIALASKTWQIEYAMNNAGIKGKLIVKQINKSI